MPSINATAFDLVPTTLAVLLAWLRWEAPLVVEVVEPAELHEPWFVVVVAPDAARLPPRWANITLDSSITAKNETIVFTTPPFWILERAALRAEICTIGTAEIATLSKNAASDPICTGICFLSDEKRIHITLSHT